ncbi:EF-hand domain-containing protein [Chelativorans sp. YIM 93263]|uniref:EF-hand domain-containing protein n=1 Tax=Chelativorans sp. YIM 93263 TaxID=2906648 RepID=UPI00237921CE|nr:EF-hand domain-containing protein [Chelativorans sp. YIM 93263]
MTKHTLIAVIAAAFAGPALAQAVDFESIDIDQSGAITLPELRAVLPDLAEETFSAIDADGSGDLGPEEFSAIVSD